ncbi:MAG: FAD-dependent oxidoreductase [Candidatus Firestonebacteria bacterium]|nr:FAD-dependent oxidoreductase [Candidatus Firestonebacteria bacterium]
MEIFDTIIIGGGISGLSTGYKLSKQNRNIAIFERSPVTGGLIRSMLINNYNIEGFYHHLFINDIFLLDLLEELKVEVTWNYTKTAFCYKNGLFEFSSQMDLIKFPPLSFFEKLKMGLCLARLLKTKNIELYDNTKASDWLIENLGEHIYEKFFKPLLWDKYNTDMNDISLAWLMGRLDMRSKRSNKGEKLGYIKGGYINLLLALEKEIKNAGNRIFTNAQVIKINKIANKLFEVHVNINNEIYKYNSRSIISTIHPTYLSYLIDFPDEYKNKMGKLKYQGSICILFAMENKLTDYYWINIMEQNINFGAIIEHTNFQPFSLYNEHIIYLASYPSIDSKLWQMNDNEVFDVYYHDMEILFPDQIRKNKLKWFKVIRTGEAGLVYKIGTKSLIPDFKSPISGIFLTGMFNCYPRRPINEIIKNSEKCCIEVSTYLTM